MKNTLLSIGYVFFGFYLCFAQPGALDTSFGERGLVVTDMGFNFWPHSMAIQDDDKIVVVGNGPLAVASGGRIALIRYLSDGTIDSSFATNGIAQDSIYPAGMTGHAVDILTNNQIVVAGYSWPDEHMYLSKFNSDGTMDTSFGNNGRVIINRNPENIRIEEVHAKDNGKIILAGHIKDPNGELDFILFQFLSTGDLDSTFGDKGITITDFGKNDERLRDMVIQPDGKIVVCGRNNYRTGSGSERRRDYILARYNSNGSIDSTFGTNGFTITDYPNSFFAWTLGLQSDGKIVVGVREGSDYVAIRFTQFGVLDTSFADSGKAVVDIPYPVGGIRELVIQENDKIVMSAEVIANPTIDFTAIRLLPEGQLDTTFGNMGLIITDFDSTQDECVFVSLQKTGKIVLAGRSTDSTYRKLALARYFGDSLSVGISPLKQDFDLEVYPNPLEEKCTLHFELEKTESLGIYLLDQMGRKVQVITRNKRFGPGIHKLAFDTNKLVSGVYYLLVNGKNNKRAWVKLLK